MVSIYPDHFCRNMTIFVLEPSQEDCLEGALELRRLRPKRRRRSFRRWDAERQSHPPRTSGETFAAAELFVTQTDPQAPEQKSALNISWCHLSAGSIMRTFLSLHPLSPPHLPVGQGPGTAVKDAAQGKRESVAPPCLSGPFPVHSVSRRQGRELQRPLEFKTWQLLRVGHLWLARRMFTAHAWENSTSTRCHPGPGAASCSQFTGHGGGCTAPWAQDGVLPVQFRGQKDGFVGREKSLTPVSKF